MKILQALFLAAASLILVNCATPEQPSDASAAEYPAPDRIENQRNLQEMHGDILRNDF